MAMNFIARIFLVSGVEETLYGGSVCMYVHLSIRLSLFCNFSKRGFKIASINLSNTAKVHIA